MKIRKFNEAKEAGLTYGQVLELLDKDQAKLINCEKGDIKRTIDDMVSLSLKRRNKDILDESIDNGDLLQIAEDFCIVMNGDLPPVIIGEYEISNPFTFGDVVVVPGRDSITCYNKITGESGTYQIR